jgi:hypothetical protein
VRHLISQDVAIDGQRTHDERFQNHCPTPSLDSLDYKVSRGIVKASARGYNLLQLKTFGRRYPYKIETTSFASRCGMYDPLAVAILKTLSYADLFDYALTREEVFRFLIGMRASRSEIDRALDDHSRLNGNVVRVDGFVILPARQDLVAGRVHWRTVARDQSSHAASYARLIAHLPFVRMVALTGGLAMENARDDDIDYMIVTAPRRLWLVRGLTVVLVRLARLRGHRLCPNFLVTENSLTIPDENLYTAHEIVQMIPLYGLAAYNQFRKLNRWTENYLPNSDEPFHLKPERPLSHVGFLLKRVFERSLGGAVGDRLERWEMKRKIRKLKNQVPATADSVSFSADVCRGFFSGHLRRTLHEFDERVNRLLSKSNQ